LAERREKYYRYKKYKRYLRRRENSKKWRRQMWGAHLIINAPDTWICQKASSGGRESSVA
jgi:hypothetical protein